MSVSRNVGETAIHVKSNTKISNMLKMLWFLTPVFITTGPCYWPNFTEVSVVGLISLKSLLISQI